MRPALRGRLLTIIQLGAGRESGSPQHDRDQHTSVVTCVAGFGTHVHDAVDRLAAEPSSQCLAAERSDRRRVPRACCVPRRRPGVVVTAAAELQSRPRKAASGSGDNQLAAMHESCMCSALLTARLKTQRARCSALCLAIDSGLV